MRLIRREEAGMKSPRYWTVVLLLAERRSCFSPVATPIRFLHGSPCRSFRTRSPGIQEATSKSPGNARCSWGGTFCRVPTPEKGIRFHRSLHRLFPDSADRRDDHSPKNCLPGAGWVFESSQYVELSDATGKAHPWRIHHLRWRQSPIRHLLVRGARRQRGQ